MQTVEYSHIGKEKQKMVGKYAWSFNKEENNWGNATHISIENCIEDATQYAKNNIKKDKPLIVFVGEIVEYFPIAKIKEALERSGREDCLSAVVSDFIEEYKRSWNLYKVVNIKEYTLKLDK